MQVEVRAQTHPAPLTPLSPEVYSARRLAANVTLFGRCWYQGVEWVGLRGRRGPVPLSLVIAGGLEAASGQRSPQCFEKSPPGEQMRGPGTSKEAVFRPGRDAARGRAVEQTGRRGRPARRKPRERPALAPRSTQAVSAPLHLFLSPAAVWPRVPKRTRHLASASHTCALAKPSQQACAHCRPGGEAEVRTLSKEGRRRGAVKRL